MNDLRILHQVDSKKKVISLEFKQISTLEPLMPLLIKFQNLQSLSLHGNRLKSLPEDMSKLQYLQEFDISNNLFLDIHSTIQSLKTIPNLTHLLYSFKDQGEENIIKDSLPQLERLNKKPIHFQQRQFTYNQFQHKQTMKLSEKDLENVGVIYDQIRQIYRENKYLVDKELATDFDYNVQNIMSDLALKLKTETTNTQKNCTIVSGKYALIDLCFVKLITYFYHYDKKIAACLQKIHDEQASMFRNMSQLVISETNNSKVQYKKVRLQKQEIYKKEIKRVKQYQSELNKHVEYLEKKNRQMLEKLMKYGKANVLQSSIIKALPSKTSRSAKSPTKSHDKYSHKDNSTVVNLKNKPKQLTIHQLKELMSQIYASKQRHNLTCKNTGQIMETMETHMYTYLNQKYGLKSLSVEWAISVVNGIRKYGIDDPQIGTFGKVLRNQVNEEFAEQLRKTKQNFQDTYKKFKNSSQFNVEDHQISVFQAQQILLYMQIKREQIKTILNKIKDEKMLNNCISVQTLEKSLLEYYIKRHDQKIDPLYRLFKEIDDDQDGIIDDEGLEILASKINKNIDTNEFVNYIDPEKMDINTFSHVCECMLRNPVFKDFFTHSQ